MKIALGADSVGKSLLDVIAAHLARRPELTVADLSGPGFYADVAAKVSRAVLAGEYDRGILFCGTGIGVCISANKVPGIRAALTHDAYSAERAAKSNNAQIITMGVARHRPRIGQGHRRCLAPLRSSIRRVRRRRTSRRSTGSTPARGPAEAPRAPAPKECDAGARSLTPRWRGPKSAAAQAA